MFDMTDNAAPKPNLDIELAKQQVKSLLLGTEIDDFLYKSEIGTFLKHPLVSTLFHESQRTFYEGLLAQNTQVVLDKLSAGKPESALHFFAKPYRLEGLLAMAPAMTDAIFWSSAADVWQMVEWPSESAAQWHTIFKSGRPGRDGMMDAQEHAKLASMPEAFTIFRGTVSHDKTLGMSWTINREQAAWFAKRSTQFFKGKPNVLERTITKTDVIAYLAGRGENEIIVLLD